jgi:hypothetical protein
MLLAISFQLPPSLSANEGLKKLEALIYVLDPARRVLDLALLAARSYQVYFFQIFFLVQLRPNQNLVFSAYHKFSNFSIT